MRGGARPGAGRPRGKTNQRTADIKAAIHEAFEKLGGATYLARVGREKPDVFCALVGKLIPRDMQLTSEIGPQLADILREIAERRSRRDSGMGAEPATLRDGSVAGHA